MQDVAYLVVNGKKVKVLRRLTKYGVDLKLRKGGDDGTFLSAESYHFESEQSLFDELLRGKVVKV